MTAETVLVPPAAPAVREPHDVIRDALGLTGQVADDVAGRIVVALGDAGWWFVHDTRPGKRAGYRVQAGASS